jgi:hypothetical protein
VIGNSQVEQRLLRHVYQDLVRREVALPRLADVEFRCYSQNGEDGVLHYLFSLFEPPSRRVVEICAGDGSECNAANLLINHGWEGLLFDGNADNVVRGTAFYQTHPDTKVSPPRFIHEWLTTDNVDTLVRQAGFAGPIGLLSMDVDGNDYWLLEALRSVEPAVIVAEFNAACGPHRRVTMDYAAGYSLDYSSHPYRCGASLAALACLARRRGLRLVGVQSAGFNAFFVRDGLAARELPERSPEECYAATERLARWHPAQLEAILAGPEPWVAV